MTEADPIAGRVAPSAIRERVKNDAALVMGLMIAYERGRSRAFTHHELGELLITLHHVEAALADPPVPSGPGIELIADERRRQISVEGWAPEHDDRHDLGELVTAAICYAVAGSALTRNQPIPDIIATRWPWERAWWKPSDDPIRNLVKAGALIAAEIDRLCRGATR
jgi:hypothetical protein